MDIITGRTAEFQLLNKYMGSRRAEFVAIYGRRRVGKTFLIRNFFQDQFDFFATGIIGGSKKEEMAAFNRALAKYGHKGAKAKTWMEAFAQLGDLLETKKRKKRCVVFIDELPCFDTRNAGFVHALDYFWNSKGAWMDNLFFVICGSATSWIIRNIIDNHGGLHNRITHEMHLKPFTLQQAEDYVASRNGNWNRLSILHAYMAVGGVPYYWSLFDFEDSVAANIDRLFFSDDAELHREYKRLFMSLYKNADNYMEIIGKLAEHKQGLTRKEIAEKLKMRDNGHLSGMLDDLVNCDFVRSYHNGGKQNRAIFQLMDFYTLFYHHFCKKRSSDIHFWQNKIGSPSISTWYGLAYERICMYHIRHVIQALHLDTIHTEFYSWRSKESEPGAQIDIIIDRSDDMITLCEVKYSKTKYSLPKDEYERILHRADAFTNETKCKKGIQIVLVTTFGQQRSGNYPEIASRSITLDDFFVDLPMK